MLEEKEKRRAGLESDSRLTRLQRAPLMIYPAVSCSQAAGEGTTRKGQETGNIQVVGRGVGSGSRVQLLMC